MVEYGVWSPSRKFDSHWSPQRYIAQMEERLFEEQEVGGSIPSVPALYCYLARGPSWDLDLTCNEDTAGSNPVSGSNRCGMRVTSNRSISR